MSDSHAVKYWLFLSFQETVTPVDSRSFDGVKFGVLLVSYAGPFAAIRYFFNVGFYVVVSYLLYNSYDYVICFFYTFEGAQGVTASIKNIEYSFFIMVFIASRIAVAVYIEHMFWSFNDI